MNDVGERLQVKKSDTSWSEPIYISKTREMYSQFYELSWSEEKYKEERIWFDAIWRGQIDAGKLWEHISGYSTRRKGPKQGRLMLSSSCFLRTSKKWV